MGLLGVLLASVTLAFLYSRCFFCRKGGCPVYNDHFAGRGAGASCNSARGCYGGRGRVRMLEVSLTLSLSLLRQQRQRHWRYCSSETRRRIRCRAGC
eukprot:scaffold68136_cov55-Phaeocystis_antarctica.AAC.6